MGNKLFNSVRWGIALQTAGNFQTDDPLRATRTDFLGGGTKTKRPFFAVSGKGEPEIRFAVQDSRVGYQLIFGLP